MGKQVRFVMLPDDEKDFFDFIFQRDSVKILLDISQTPDFIISRDEFLNSPNLHRIFFWDSKMSPYPTSIQNHFYQKFDNELGSFVPTNEIYYNFDQSTIHVIEYIRSIIRSDGKLTVGRIWTESQILHDNTTIPKTQEFLSWYGEIEHWIRKKSTRDSEINAYKTKRVSDWCGEKGSIFYLR